MITFVSRIGLQPILNNLQGLTNRLHIVDNPSGERTYHPNHAPAK